MTPFLALAAIAATLTGVVAWEAALLATASPVVLPGRSATIDPVSRAGGSTPDEPAAAWVATALERPLFRENRRPAKSADAEIHADGVARLIGVMTGPFGKRAIFLSPGQSKPIIVSEGGQVTGFVVRSIGPGQATVETEGIIRILRPSFADNSSAWE